MPLVSLDIAFFVTIDARYVKTFFSTRTATKFIRELFLTSEEDYQRFDAAFSFQKRYISSIRSDVKEWMSSYIQRWQREGSDWFKIELIPDEYVGELASRENETTRSEATIFCTLVLLKYYCYRMLQFSYRSSLLV